MGKLQSRQPAGVSSGGQFAPTRRAEAEASLETELKASGSSFACHECGGEFRYDDHDVTSHVGPDGSDDFDANEDHVPFGDEPWDEAGPEADPDTSPVTSAAPPAPSERDVQGRRSGSSYRPYGPESWATRPVHDLFTEMAPDMEAHIRGLRRAGQRPPEGVTDSEWGRKLQRVERSFALGTSLKDRPMLNDAEQSEFDAGMTEFRMHAVDGRLVAHTATTVTPALNRFADHIARLNGHDVSEDGGEHEPSQRESEARRCAADFEQARSNFVNGISSPESAKRTEAAAAWFADNYLRLWT